MSGTKPLNESQDVPMTVAQDAWDIPQSKLVNFGQVPPEKLSTANLDVTRQNVMKAQIRAMMATPK